MLIPDIEKEQVEADRKWERHYINHYKVHTKKSALDKHLEEPKKALLTEQSVLEEFFKYKKK